jgi:hypothetical protein
MKNLLRKIKKVEQKNYQLKISNLQFEVEKNQLKKKYKKWKLQIRKAKKSFINNDLKENI